MTVVEEHGSKLESLGYGSRITGHVVRICARATIRVEDICATGHLASSSVSISTLPMQLPELLPPKEMNPVVHPSDRSGLLAATCGGGSTKEAFQAPKSWNNIAGTNGGHCGRHGQVQHGCLGNVAKPGELPKQKVGFNDQIWLVGGVLG